MCNFIKSNGEQCKLARNKDRCGKHRIIIDREEIIVEETNIVEEMPPQLSTTAIGEVVYTPEPSAIKPVESSNVKVSEVPNADESIVAPVIADRMVYKEDQSLDSELNISDAEAKGITWDTCRLEYDNKDILKFSEVIDAWRSLAKKIPIDHQWIKNADPQVLFDHGYISPIQLENRKDGKASSRKRIYFKSDDDKETFLGLYEKLDFVEYCVSNKIYDSRLYKLYCMMTDTWFRDNNNLWNLAGMLYKKQHVDLGLMRKTYLCILHTMTDRFDQAAALKLFNDWGTSKYHPKLTESQIKSIAGGSNPDAYKLWKAEYEPKEVKEKKEKKDKKTPLDILKEKLIDLVKDKYKREFQSGAIYENMLPYYYVRKYDDPATFLNVVFATEPLFHMCKSQDHQQLLYFIKNIINPNFEFIKLDYNYIGFKNGIYDLSNATFVLTADIVENIQVRTYIDSEFEIDNDYAPLLDQYMKFQFDDETIEFIYFMIGRLMTKLNDKFDFMVFLFGEGGSGKSLLMNLVKYSFAHDQVGFLSNSHQEQFGLSEYAKKQILCCDDMNNLAKTLPKADFLSMGTRGSVQCPVKGKGSIPVHDWNIPTIINSNKLPNYKDESGEVVRRFMVANFEKIIPEERRNTNLENEIKEQEFGVFLHRCLSTYLKFHSKYKNKGVETFCPVSFIENRNLLRMATNNTYQFIADKCKYEEGASISVPQLNKAMRAYIKEKYEMKQTPKDAINISNIVLVDNRYVENELNICKSCRKEHKKGCCDEYDRLNRSKSHVIQNITFSYGIADED